MEKLKLFKCQWDDWNGYWDVVVAENKRRAYQLVDFVDPIRDVIKNDIVEIKDEKLYERLEKEGFDFKARRNIGTKEAFKFKLAEECDYEQYSYMWII